jgi:hypothetical protein
MKQEKKFHELQKLSVNINSTNEVAREIADSYIESQKEIINSVQSAWSPFVENFNRTNWNTVFSPGRVSEI